MNGRDGSILHGFRPRGMRKYNSLSMCLPFKKAPDASAVINFLRRAVAVVINFLHPRMSTSGCFGAALHRGDTSVASPSSKSLPLFVQMAQESMVRSAMIFFASSGGTMVTASYFIHVLHSYSSAPCADTARIGPLVSAKRLMSFELLSPLSSHPSRPRTFHSARLIVKTSNMTTLVASCLGRLKDIGISSKSRRRTLGPRLSRRASHPSDCLRWYLAQVAVLVSAALRDHASQDLKHLTQRPRKLPLELVVVLGVSGALSLWCSGPYAGSIHPD